MWAPDEIEWTVGSGTCALTVLTGESVAHAEVLVLSTVACDVTEPHKPHSQDD